MVYTLAHALAYTVVLYLTGTIILGHVVQGVLDTSLDTSDSDKSTESVDCEGMGVGNPFLTELILYSAY